MFVGTAPSRLSQSLAAAVFALVALASASAEAGALAPFSPPLHLALSALGDLSSYRDIASDTLARVETGDVSAARARVKDLETAWDKAESTLKPRDKATWTVVDKMIDTALTDLRTPNPKPDTCAASLKALIAKMVAVDKA